MRYFTLFLLALVSLSCLAQQSDAPQKPSIPLTTITFDEPNFMFGEITDGEQIQNVFRFTNTGDAPLVISNAKGSCGCTVPDWPKAPIMPGESSFFLVKFDSKNKKGKQTKRVTITANTDPALSFLTIAGEIIKKEVPETLNTSWSDQAFSMSGEKSSESIKLFPNPASDILKIKIDDHNGKSANVEIYNSQGQKILSQDIEEINDETLGIDISAYTPGTYVAAIKIQGMFKIANQFIVVK